MSHGTTMENTVGPRREPHRPWTHRQLAASDRSFRSGHRIVSVGDRRIRHCSGDRHRAQARPLDRVYSAPSRPRPTVLAYLHVTDVNQEEDQSGETETICYT